MPVSKFIRGQIIIACVCLLLPVVSCFALPTYLSPTALVAASDGKTLYIAEHTAGQVAAYDVAKGKVVNAIPVSGNPSGLALDSKGRMLYVTIGSPAGAVRVINLASGKVAGTLQAGHTPVSPVLAPNAQTLYVCDRFDNSVSIIDIATKKIITKVRVPREPIAAAITPDGKSLLVTNLLPAVPSNGNYVSAEVSVIDTSSKKLRAGIRLPNGSTSLRGIAISPDGKYAYVTHILSRFQFPTTQLERGWMNTNALSIIDITEMKWLNTILIDEIDLGSANPWGVVCSPDGSTICVTSAGSHEISIIDRAKLHKRLSGIEKGEKQPGYAVTVDDVPNDLLFLTGIRRRVKLAGNGPREIVMVDSTAYVTEYFSDSLGICNTDLNVADRPKSIALGPKVQITAARKGEMLFNDANLCFQKWQSCVSCHPDGRSDGLNWDLMNDGIGNHKNTKSMILSHKTPPVMVTGVRVNAEAAVRSGIKFIQFEKRPDTDASAIDEYLKGLIPVPSPYLVNGKLSDSAEQGRKIFAKAGCISCHSGTLFTDLKSYDVGTGIDRDKGRKFDTPTLVECWRTAPYLYDGRALTIEEVLTKYNKDDQHGVTSRLNRRELDDLVHYVLSL
jgi:YVTN family beta-propeller protein